MTESMDMKPAEADESIAQESPLQEDFTPLKPKLLPGGVPRSYLNESEETDQLWRLFIAIELPKHIKSELDSLANQMFSRPRRPMSRQGQDSNRYRQASALRRNRPSGFRRKSVHEQSTIWTPGENLHITVKFLGNALPQDVPDIKEAMRRVSEEAATLNISLSETGCFPGDRTPRVLWTGIKGDIHRLTSTAAMLEGALELAGFNVHANRFVPHITVGRVRSGTAKRVLAEIGGRWIRLGPNASRSSMHIKALTLMRSHLRPKRPPRYERIFRTPLG